MNIETMKKTLRGYRTLLSQDWKPENIDATILAILDCSALSGSAPMSLRDYLRRACEDFLDEDFESRTCIKLDEVEEDVDGESNDLLQSCAVYLKSHGIEASDEQVYHFYQFASRYMMD